MNINISTKYNVGDTVYLIEYYGDYAPSNPFIITYIDIGIDNDGLKIYYTAEQEGTSYKVLEERCFGTHEECAKWCEEHN